MIITVASGKGGTGKTTVAVSLALGTGAELLPMDGQPVTEELRRVWRRIREALT